MSREFVSAPFELTKRWYGRFVCSWGKVMFRNTSTGNIVRCSFTAFAVFGYALAAQAQDEIDYDHMLGVTEVQLIAAQRMSAEALLVTLGIDRELNLEHLETSRNEFDRILTALRDGDPALQISPLLDPELLRYIEEAEQGWIPMEAAIADCLSGAPITAAHVGAITEGSYSLYDALNDLSDGLRERSKIDSSYSMLGVAMETASRTTMLSQQMTKEFLLVAYGHQAGRNRSALRETAEQFQTGLQGLIEGDIDRLLLAAPTPGIRAQLQNVQRVWNDDFRPLIERAVSEGELNAGAVARMARVNLSLLHEIQLTGAMYRQL